MFCTNPCQSSCAFVHFLPKAILNNFSESINFPSWTPIAPDIIKAESKTNLPSAFWDVMPTLEYLIGASYTETTDGLSFLPILQNSNKKEGAPNFKVQKMHGPLYWEFHGNTNKQTNKQTGNS